MGFAAVLLGFIGGLFVLVDFILALILLAGAWVIGYFVNKENTISS